MELPAAVGTVTRRDDHQVTVQGHGSIAGGSLELARLQAWCWPQGWSPVRFDWTEANGPGEDVWEAEVVRCEDQQALVKAAMKVHERRAAEEMMRAVTGDLSWSEANENAAYWHDQARECAQYAVETQEVTA